MSEQADYRGAYHHLLGGVSAIITSMDRSHTAQVTEWRIALKQALLESIQERPMDSDVLKAVAKITGWRVEGLIRGSR